MNQETKDKLIEWAGKYNDPFYFVEDPIAFPRHFNENGSRLEDIEVASVFAAHFAWGRRSMIVRDCERLFEEMEWKPYEYVMAGSYRDDDVSAHRTVKWSEVAAICSRLKEIYKRQPSIESMSASEMRADIFGQKEDGKAANKKINMMRRWMVRDDGKVDLGLWHKTDKRELIIPLDIHVYDEAVALGLTDRKQKDIVTAIQITESFKEIFPDDPCLGDFALFGYGVSKNQ